MRSNGAEATRFRSFIATNTFTLGILFSGIPAHLNAQVLPDGTTSTSVVVNANGSVTVGIAPTGSDGVSLNRYTDFNVSESGVQLDNRTEAARTIVNEVTGTSRTDISGPVEVLGQRAHVIIANPNGIVIDGGRFVNTGRVALTTGQISTNSNQIAPGIYQDNVVATVDRGTIIIEGDGLSGQMDAVDLIAHTIRVNGAISNESANSGARIRLAAGSSSTEFNSAVLPGNTGLSWSRVTGTGATSDGAVLVEIMRSGALKANTIGIEVSDTGAGVRYAGEGYATAREFTLSADGQIDLNGAQLSAQTALVAAGGSITADGAALSASGAMSLVAADATGNGIAGHNLTANAQDVFLSSESNLSFGALDGNVSKLTTTSGDIVFQAKGQMTDTGSEFAAQRNVLINADVGLTFSGSMLKASEGSIQLDTQGSLIATDTVANAFGHLLVTADDTTFVNDRGRTEFVAENGSLVLTTLGLETSGDLTNAGALLQGGVRAEGLRDSADTESDGAVTLNVKGSLLNTGGENLAVIFGAGGDVSVQTGVDIKNNRGRILANGDIRLVSEGDIYNFVDAPNGAVDPEVLQYARKGKRQWWTLWIKRKREAYVSHDYGVLESPDQLATLTASGGIQIEAGGSLLNQGGQINANDGDLDIRALNVETVGLGSGQIYVRKVCVLTCSYEGDGTVAYYGGQINASGSVHIEALERFYNGAGSVFALDDVAINAPEIELEAALVPTLVTRPKGLYNFWASKAAWIFLRDQYGSIVADTGNITVSSDRPVRITGGTLSAGGKIELENGQDIVRAPGAQSDALNHSIGFGSNLPLIRQ